MGCLVRTPPLTRENTPISARCTGRHRPQNGLGRRGAPGTREGLSVHLPGESTHRGAGRAGECDTLHRRAPRACRLGSPGISGVVDATRATTHPPQPSARTHPISSEDPRRRHGLVRRPPASPPVSGPRSSSRAWEQDVREREKHPSQRGRIASGVVRTVVLHPMASGRARGARGGRPLRWQPRCSWWRR